MVRLRLPLSALNGYTLHKILCVTEVSDGVSGFMNFIPQHHLARRSSKFPRKKEKTRENSILFYSARRFFLSSMLCERKRKQETTINTYLTTQNTITQNCIANPLLRFLPFPRSRTPLVKNDFRSL